MKTFFKRVFNIKTKYHYQGMVYFDKKGLPTEEMTDSVLWKDKITIEAYSSKEASARAFELFHFKYPELKGKIYLFKGVMLDKFIKTFETKKNILNEDGLPNFYCDGWSSWNNWNGKLNDNTYKIRLSRLYVRVYWYEKDKIKNICDEITKAVIIIAKQSGLKEPYIDNINLEMYNPDRCVYEGTLHCN